MTEGHALLGSLRAENGRAVIRMEDRFATTPEDLWSALTEPQRLARWLATVTGDLDVGGRFHATFTSGWAGPGRVETCEPPSRLLVSLAPDAPDATQVEAWLHPDGSRTRLIVEERGVPLAEAAAFGAGWQAHLEDLAGYLDDRTESQWEARWAALTAQYEALGAQLR